MNRLKLSRVAQPQSAPPRAKNISMRIVSLLPSATEILYALGVGDEVVGVTHECDFPPEAARKPALIKPRVDPTAAPAEIDRQVSELVARGESIYAVDGDLLASLAPDLIVTQDLCHVCAASPDDLATALSRFSRPPRVLTLTPHSLDDVWQDIIRAGEATDTLPRAESLAADLKARVQAVASITASTDAEVFSAARTAASTTASAAPQTVAQFTVRPRVACLEWLDPLYVGGHWVPEMVAIAGGEDVLGRAGHPSFKVTADDVAQSNADIILVMLCGYNAKRNAAEFQYAKIPSSWQNLPAIRNRRIFAVDANSHFSRPGPRLADGVELLAHLFNPQRPQPHLPAATYVEL
ncbi:MAG: cobalamin-binding protein [Candidatus Acidiferrales bacterium]